MLARFLFLVLICCFLTPTSYGQQREMPDPYRFLVWPVKDARAFLRDATSNKAVRVAAASGALYLLTTQDARITRAATHLHEGPLNTPTRAIEELGNAKAMRPVALMVLVGSMVSGDDRMQDAALTSLEAVIFANLITNGLKAVSGRSRPYQEKGSREFTPFSGNTSFPSGHATTVFALATPWLIYYPDPVTKGFMVLASATALSRVTTDRHWLSDVVAGAAIGYGMGKWLSNRHLSQQERVIVAPAFGDGVGITVEIRP